MNRDRVARIIARERSDARAERMVEVLNERDSQALGNLRADAITELQKWSEIELVPLDADTELSSDCSISGVYIEAATPPRIGVARSASRARDNFTALHELGHHLQATDDDLIAELADQPDRGRRLEEESADRFAARVLVPHAVKARVLGGGTPTALQIVALWEEAAASRAAVCVAAAQQLESPGHVLLLDDAGVVNFSATKGEFPIARGSDQSGTEIWRRLERSTLSAVHDRTRFFYRGGTRGRELYAQATSISGFTLVIAVADKAPWEALSLSSTATPVLGGWHDCLSCGETFRSFEPCERGCGSYRCPNGHCACQHQMKEQTCLSCFLAKPIHLFGDGNICLECLD